MNIIGSSLLTATSVSPVVFVYGAMALIENQRNVGLWLIGVGVGLVLLCLLMLISTRRLEHTCLSITSVESADTENIAIIVLYVVPLLEISFVQITWQFIVPAGVILLSLMITESSYNFNPLLNFLGWRFYRVGTDEGITYLLISRNKKIRSTLTPLKVRELTNYTLIEVKRG